MTTPKAGTWQTILGEFAPDLIKKVTGLQETVLMEGALSIKTTTLMMMLCDALLAVVNQRNGTLFKPNTLA